MTLLELLILILVVCWLGGWGFGIGGSLIHVLLVVVVICAIFAFLQRLRP